MNNRQETTDHFNSLLGKSATNVMDRLRRYLLGDESDDGREEIELALIADGRVSDVLALVEDELKEKPAPRRMIL